MAKVICKKSHQTSGVNFKRYTARQTYELDKYDPALFEPVNDTKKVGPEKVRGGKK